MRIIGELGKWNSYGDFTLLGRVLSALFDVGTVFMLFLLGRRLFDWRVGALGAFLVAVTPLHIQQSHYFVMDAIVTFFVTVALYYAVRVAQEGRLVNYTLLGVFYGLAVASKINAATFGLVIFTACAIRIWRTTVEARATVRPTGSGDGVAARRAGFDWAVLNEPLVGFCLALVCAFLMFRIFQPNAFTGPGFLDVGLSPKYVADLDTFRKISSGEVDYPPGVQFANRAKFIYPIEQLVVWAMGVPLGVASFSGIALALVTLMVAWHRRRPGFLQRLLLLIPLVWIAFNLYYWGGNFASASRYFMTIMPPLVLFASWALVELAAWARRQAPASVPSPAAVAETDIRARAWRSAGSAPPGPAPGRAPGCRRRRDRRWLHPALRSRLHYDLLADDHASRRLRVDLPAFPAGHAHWQRALGRSDPAKPGGPSVGALRRTAARAIRRRRPADARPARSRPSTAPIYSRSPAVGSTSRFRASPSATRSPPSTTGCCSAANWGSPPSPCSRLIPGSARLSCATTRHPIYG